MGGPVLVKLALGYVRRSVRDFSVYFVTLALTACLFYSFFASTDYLLALDLSADQRARFAQAGGVLGASSVLAVVIFIFLISYANAFLVRRRRREFGRYALLGMGQRRVSTVLALEGGAVGAASLVAGIAAGVALTPLFALVAAFVFGVAWQPVFTVSPAAATQSAGAFLAITVIAAARSARSVRKLPLVELLRGNGSRTPFG